MRVDLRLPLLLLGVMVAAAGCGGALQETQGGTADFDRAKAAYDRRDYMDAIADFKAYVELFPGTEKTDDALYYLGEAYFRQKDFALASGSFDRLIRDFPNSPFQADALYELARCDDFQSHPAALDQSETLRALSRYNQFLEQYPDHPKAGDARARSIVLRDRLAQKRFLTGRLYHKLHQENAAAMSLRVVLRDYPDSKWVVDSALLLADVLEKQGKQDEAIDTLKKLLASLPEGETRRRTDERLRSLERSEADR